MGCSVLLNIMIAKFSKFFGRSNVSYFEDFFGASSMGSKLCVHSFLFFGRGGSCQLGRLVWVSFWIVVVILVAVLMLVFMLFVFGFVVSWLLFVFVCSVFVCGLVLVVGLGRVGVVFFL